MNYNDHIKEEIWKPVTIDLEFTNECRFEISNKGRVRSFNKISNGNILKGSLTEGYKIIRTKLFKPRTPEKQAVFDELKKEISELYARRRDLKKNHATYESIEYVSSLIKSKKTSLSNRLKSDLKKRTINYHFVVHRLIATYFLPEPKPEETIVGHLDFDKLNNKVENLKWMTPEENLEHQQNSPYVKDEKLKRKYIKRGKTNGMKLNSTQVMHIKILLKKGRPVKELVKKFKVSEMQIWRIKSGENWSHVVIPD